MALRLIVKEGDSILEKPCRKVEVFDEKIHRLLDDMADTMYAANGVGLAGPQVGVLRRVCVIDIGEGLIELINPQIVEREGERFAQEGCLSSPGKSGITKRPQWVKAVYQNRLGEECEIQGQDLLAQALCHEIDHLDGVLFKNHVVRWESK